MSKEIKKEPKLTLYVVMQASQTHFNDAEYAVINEEYETQMLHYDRKFEILIYPAGNNHDNGKSLS